MTTYVSVLDNSKTNLEGVFKYLNWVFSPGVPTSFVSTSLKVVQRGAGANMSVDVSVGHCMLERPTQDYSFVAWQDAVTNVAITAADPSNPRITTIVAWVNTATTTTASNNSPGALEFKAINGTAAGSPVAPTDSAIQTNLGSSVAWTRLADITVGTGVTSITTANITDRRSAITSRLAIGSGAISSASMFSTDLNPETRLSETTSNFVSSGCVWSSVSGLNGTMTSGVVYIAGKRLVVASVASKAFTASKDTYVDISSTGSVSYNEVSNNASAPALSANNVRLAKVVTSGSAITAVVITGCDSNGVRIYPNGVWKNDDTGWIDVTFQNGYTAQNGTTVSVRKISGVVYFRGQIGKSSVDLNTMFTLPVGFRPSVSAAIFTVPGSSANYAKFVVNNDGTVNQNSLTGGVYIGIDTVSYPAA